MRIPAELSGGWDISLLLGAEQAVVGFAERCLLQKAEWPIINNKHFDNSGLFLMSILPYLT